MEAARPSPVPPAPDLRADALAPPRAGGPPPVRGVIRGRPEDFQVRERLRFAPAGVGGHVYLRVRKRGVNTEWVARRLAALAGVPARDVGYAGLKDRHAVAEQWFSLPCAGAEPDWGALAGEDVRVLEVTRHPRKLRRTAVAANAFSLTLREVAGDQEALLRRGARLAARGAPNYFGAQRFGRDGGNLERAARLLAGALRPSRHLRGLYLSAARSALFNRVLAARVRAGTWCRILDGEILALAGSRSRFRARPEDEGLAPRLAAGDLHPTGPLWGRGGDRPEGACGALEGSALAGLEFWCGGLEAAGLDYDRRPLRVIPGAWSLELEGDRVRLSFTLPAGAYATAVLRELAEVTDGALGPGRR